MGGGVSEGRLCKRRQVGLGFGTVSHHFIKSWSLKRRARGKSCGFRAADLTLAPAIRMVSVSATLRDQCLAAMAGAAEAVSRSWLGGLPVDAQANVSTSDEQGALVNVTAGTRPMQAGLFMAPDAAQALAKLFVGLEPSDDDLPMSDIGDALC